MEFTEIHIVVLFLVIFLFTILCLIYYYIRKLESKIEVYNRDNLLKYQRSRLEDKVYDATDKLVLDNQHFADANHLLLDASKNNELKSKREVPNYSYFNDLGILENDFKVEDKFVTCLMPFNSKYNTLYDTIKHGCKFNGFTCIRTDEEKIESNSNLRKYIVMKIIQAQFVIAVLDGRNPNVLYEVGIAHAIGKLVILLVKREKTNELPENLKGNRLLIYKNEDDLFDQLSSTLSSIEYA